MRELNSIAKAALIVLLGFAASKILGYAFRVIVARVGIEDYGVYSIGFALFNFAVVICLFGMNSGIVRYLGFFKGNKKRCAEVIGSAVKICLPLSAFFAIVLYSLAPLLSSALFHSEKLAVVLQAFAIAVPVWVMAAIFLSALQAFRKIRTMVLIRNVVEGLVRVAVSIALVALGFRLLGVLAAVISSFTLMLLLSAFELNRIVKLSGILKSRLFRDIIKYSMPLMLVDILAIASRWADTLLLGFFAAPGKVGLYNAALPTAALLMLMPWALQSLAFPIMSELHGKRSSFLKIHASVAKWTAFANIPLAVIMILFSRQVIAIVFGSDYAPAARALSILAFAYLVYSCAWASRISLAVLKKTKLLLGITAVATAFGIILNIILIPKFGIEGAAAGTGIGLVLHAILVSEFSVNSVKLASAYRQMLFAAAASLIVVTLLIRAFAAGTYSLLFFLMLFVVLYALVYVLIGGLEREDKQLIRAALKKMGVSSEYADGILE